MKKAIIAICAVALGAVALSSKPESAIAANTKLCKYDPNGVYYCCYWDGYKMICRKETPE